MTLGSPSILLRAAAILAFAAACPPAADAREAVQAKTQVVAAADARAVEAGLAVLRAGGSAVDAAIATQLVLALVEPQSSGLGGGAFLVAYDAATRSVTTYDGRETAPAAATPDLFLTPDGEPMEFDAAVVGGRSVGVPGLLRMLELAHEAQGKRPWAELFEPAIALAEDGFAVSPRLAQSIAETDRMDADPDAAAMFLTPEGTAVAAGTVLRNPAFAATLRAVAAGGADVLYTGALAQRIAAEVQGFGANPGSMTETDLAAYRAVERPAMCAPYRTWQVCGMGPPSSGGIALLQILGLLSRFDLAAEPPESLQSVHWIAEASRLAFADRSRYLADPDFVAVPVAGLIDPAYLAERSALIQGDRSMGDAVAGSPPERQGALWPMVVSEERPSTSHISIVDQWGNAVAMTTSIEGPFGSRLMVDGFMLNNELTDFSFEPEVDGQPVANRVEAGKRPRSSMAPTIVLDQDGRLVMTVGSPGGSRIIGYVAKTVIAALDWGLDIQAAIDLPHVLNRNGATELEAATAAEGLADGLRAMGHEVKVQAFSSGLQGIQATPQGLLGGADPRREGVALGD